ncbi:hypothetical protein BC834DRAFT_437032 [Gloeopeniophorella convolvens]|nr:hypothetical protein BC834DRAFT_437032 [Gloeopeniophorella convolvens]
MGRELCAARTAQLVFAFRDRNPPTVLHTASGPFPVRPANFCPSHHHPPVSLENKYPITARLRSPPPPANQLTHHSSSELGQCQRLRPKGTLIS